MNAPPSYGPSAPVVVGIQQAMAPQVGPEPTRITCPHCHHNIMTRMEFMTGTKTHIIAAILCLLGCICCVCVPYCVDSCQNGNHYCPSCNAYIGTYKN